MISVIIPTYNEESYVERAIQSISRQYYDEGVEILIADGGSEDRTVEIASGYAKVIHCPKGRAFQLNKAAKEAKGDIFFFVHADVTLPDNVLMAIKKKVTEGYDGGGFSTNFSNWNFEMKILGRIFKFHWRSVYDRADNVSFFGDNGLFVKKSVFEELQGFKNIPIMEDFDFSLRLAQSKKAVRIMSPRLIASKRRIEKTGYLKTRLQWLMITFFYKLGVSPFYLAKYYKDVR